MEEMEICVTGTHVAEEWSECFVFFLFFFKWSGEFQFFGEHGESGHQLLYPFTSVPVYV